jgi:hypothetical protein
MNVTDELAGADFGDRRLTRRLLKLVERLGPDPSASFPDAAGDDATLEATYRFFQNESVTPERILAPHIAATVRRCREAERVIIAHDTTELSFPSKREGLGRVNDAGTGFFAHYAIAIADAECRRPLGVLGLHTYTRQGPPKREKHTERIAEEERESFRWASLVENVAPMLGPEVETIHVMDSEADAFWLFRRLVESGTRFVIRLTHDRAVLEDGERMLLSESVRGIEGRLTREVALSARAAPHRAEAGRKRNLTRSTRSAMLVFSACSLTLAAPKNEPKVKTLKLNVVHVREVDAPPGVEPVDWKLITTESIETIEDLERIVDAYRARWRIEEFFKALKTGCAIEKRQLESLSTLLNALAVFTPLAMQLLDLRSMARDAPDVPASEILRPVQLLVLQRHRSTRLRIDATARDALLAVARLGGHITNNGEPGWVVLGRGYEKLLVLEEGAALMDVINP